MTTIKEYNKYIIDFNSINSGMQLLLRFDNNYGLSIVCDSFSYGRDEGKFEITVIKFNSEDNKDWNICYDTDDVLVLQIYQSKEDVFSIIDRVILL